MSRSGYLLKLFALACPAIWLMHGCGQGDSAKEDLNGPSAPSAPIVPIARAIVVKRFEILTEMRGNDVLLHVDTDLPASTSLIWAVGRHYWRREHGESVEYIVEFYSKKVTAGEAAQPVSIDVADTVFNQKLADASKTAQKFNVTSKMAKISDDLEVDVVVGINQDLPFATDNANLEGAVVSSIRDIDNRKIIRASHLIHRPLGYHDVAAERKAVVAAEQTPFPGLDAYRLSRVVVGDMPTAVRRAIPDPEYQDNDGALNKSGSVRNDLGEFCAYEQHTLIGVRYFYPVPLGTVADSFAVLSFVDKGCMRAHIPGDGLVTNALSVNQEVAKIWLNQPERDGTTVADWRLPADDALQGLCIARDRGSSALVQYVIHDGAIVAVLHFGSLPPTCNS